MVGLSLSSLTSIQTNSNTTNNSNSGNGSNNAGNRVWVQQEAIDGSRPKKSFSSSLNSSNNGSSSSLKSVSRSFQRRPSSASLTSAAGGALPFSDSDSIDGASHCGSVSVSLAPSGAYGAGGRRQLTWGWKAGYLVENCAGGGVVVRLEEAGGFPSSAEDTTSSSSNGTASTIASSFTGEHGDSAASASASASSASLIRLGPNAFRDGQVVLSNEYPVDAETGQIQPPSDLITLTHLHEPSVVESLQHRYATDQIYTSTGPVLLALNPFQTVRGLYGESSMRRYWDRAERNLAADDLPPHVYAIADAAFRNMMRKLDDDLTGTNPSVGNDGPADDEAASSTATASSISSPGAAANGTTNAIFNKQKGCNQSILVSGESGAGKTVTAKFVMKYLAALSQRSAVIHQPERRAYLRAGELKKQKCEENLEPTTTGASTTPSSSSSRLQSPSNKTKKTFQQPSWALPKPAHKKSSYGGGSGVKRSPTPSVMLRKHSSNLSCSSHQSSALSGNTNCSNSNDALASVTLLSPSSTNSNSIEAQVLQSNPILESFGNARTVRNDNSSRFGKFIEIQFTRNGQLVGATIDTYLLEKVRLVHQSTGERNYHVFYEFLAGTEARERAQYFLAPTAAPEDFKMTASGTYHRRDGVADGDTWRQLRAAMDTMKFAKADQHDVWNIVAALLHASNLTFCELPGDESCLDERNVHLHPVCNLLGVLPADLDQALCSFTIQAGSQQVERALNQQRAEKGLEALLKATYGALFTHLVQRINDSIAYREGGRRNGDDDDEEEGDDDEANQRPVNPAHRPAASIGVLDIFGFESFHTNSFEQLCINYCNEALQQQFNAFVLKNEQAEYEREGIEWSFIEFPENQDVLDLIEKRGGGILSILDDQCRAPGPSDKAFCLDVYSKCTGQPRFAASRKQTATLQFSVQHYAGPVEYTTAGFTEKNRDELPKEASELLRNSQVPFIQGLAAILEQGSGVPAAAAATPVRKTSLHRADSSVARASVGGQFRSQLRNLRTKIDVTTPHYVRCLKPNDLLVPDHFDSAVVAEQLRCGGILEAVRVARAGFTQHYPHADFVRRYRALAWRELGKKQSSNPACGGVGGGWKNGASRGSSVGVGGGGYLNGYMHGIQKSKAEPKAELSAADAKVLCKDLIKVLYRKIYQLAKEDGDEIDVPASPRDTLSPAAKSKTYSFQAATPPWSKAPLKRPTTDSPLPPVPTSAGSVKSRYAPWSKKKDSSSVSPPPLVSTTTTATTTPTTGSWRRGGLTSSDYAKVGIQMGKTKVFLRHKAFEALERIRSREQTTAATKLNSMFRRYLARLAYVPYRDAFRRGIVERRRQFEEGDEYKETKEQDYGDSGGGNGGGDPASAAHFHRAFLSFHAGGDFSADSLVDKWTESQIRDAIHNPVPRHEWGRQAPAAEEDFQWFLLDGIWVRK